MHFWCSHDITSLSHNNMQTNTTSNNNHRSGNVTQMRHIASPSHNNMQTNTASNSNHRSGNVAQTRHIASPSHNNMQTNTVLRAAHEGGMIQSKGITIEDNAMNNDGALCMHVCSYTWPTELIPDISNTLHLTTTTKVLLLPKWST